MIDGGEGTIHDAAGIIDADGQQSSHAIETCSGAAPGDGLGDDPRPWTDPVGCATPRIDAFLSPAPVAPHSPMVNEPPVRFPSPESNSDDATARRNASSIDRESNRGQGAGSVGPVQSPFTRSNPSQHPENPQKSVDRQAKSRACSTRVSYLNAPKSHLTLSNRERNRHPDCSTGASHQPSARGLWLRGSISAAGQLP